MRDDKMIQAICDALLEQPHMLGDGNAYGLAEIALSELRERPEPHHWHEGAPDSPWSEEWFIAETIYGDRVVLTALPEEYSYDFRTADDTYIRRELIKRWMQFPDSEYIEPTAAQPQREVAAPEAGRE